MAANHTSQPATLLRRLAAIGYDALLLIGIEMLAAALWLPLFADQPIESHPLRHLYQLFLLLVMAAFFIGFWWHDGQTLGMRAWHLRLQSQDGKPPSMRQLIIRLVVALLSWAAGGLGYLWSLFDPQRRTWHDLVSGTQILYEAKASKSQNQ